jgi:hypothetical protein
MIRCQCGMCIDDDVGISQCPRCGKPFNSNMSMHSRHTSDYRAAHIPARPEGQPASNTRYMRRCPECKTGELVPSEGCSMCPVCGFGYCG